MAKEAVLVHVCDCHQDFEVCQAVQVPNQSLLAMTTSPNPTRRTSPGSKASPTVCRHARQAEGNCFNYMYGFVVERLETTKERLFPHAGENEVCHAGLFLQE
jgi:hypothetical protein